MEDNEFSIRFKELPMDAINQSMIKELKIFERFCKKNVIISKFDGTIWKGFLEGYDMFQLHLKRNDEIEKILLADIDKIKEVNDGKNSNTGYFNCALGDRQSQ